MAMHCRAADAEAERERAAVRLEQMALMEEQHALRRSLLMRRHDVAITVDALAMSAHQVRLRLMCGSCVLPLLSG